MKTTNCTCAGVGDAGGALQVEGGEEVSCRGKRKDLKMLLKPLNFC